MGESCMWHEGHPRHTRIKEQVHGQLITVTSHLHSNKRYSQMRDQQRRMCAWGMGKGLARDMRSFLWGGGSGSGMETRGQCERRHFTCTLRSVELNSSHNGKINISPPLLKTDSPGWCGSVDRAPACGPKDRWFDSQSGHMPGLWARSLVWGHVRGNHTLLFLSLSFSLLSPLSRNK